MPEHTQPKAVVLHATFSWQIYACKKSKILVHIGSRDIDDQRIWQSDWTRAFLRTWEPELS